MAVLDMIIIRRTRVLPSMRKKRRQLRLIFELYLQGYGTYTIARQLTEMGRINKKGGTTWTDSGILGIIKNEKYKGDLLMKKTFTVEPYKLTFVMKGNGNTAIPNTKKNFKESAS